MKTLISISDLSKADVLKILDYADKFEKKELEPSSFAREKVLGFIFLQESLRTSASLKSAILKLGGGWIDFDLNYIKNKEEDLEDSVMAVAALVDVLAIRGPMDIDIRLISKKINTPIINAMIGMEHSISALWRAYILKRRLVKIENISIGMYGFTAYSRSAFAFYRTFAKLGAKFKEDSVIGKAGAPKNLIEEIMKNGGKFNPGNLDDFIGEIDYLFIAEGWPVEGVDKKIIKTFNKGFKPLNNEMLKKLRREAFFSYSMPRATIDGRLVVEKEADSDPRMITYEIIEKSVYVNMGVLAWLFE